MTQQQPETAPGTIPETAPESTMQLGVVPPQPAPYPYPPAYGQQPPGLVVPVPVKKDRRVLRAVLRWTAAVVVFGVVGAGVAYGVTEQKRGDLPGLATESDGRWEYPTIERPPLPSGAPDPFAEENTREEHFADLRALVLPAPKGATADKKLAGDDGWLPGATYVDTYDKDSRGDLRTSLKEGGLRQIAARGWTMPDGTRTRIYLLRFNTSAFAREHLNAITDNGATLLGAADVEESYGWSAKGSKVPFTSLHVYDEQKPYGKEQLRQAYIQAGDVIGLVVQSGAGTTPKIPFQQTVALQNQLLG
ncbi:hypothetical protein V2W30_18535 [Streptomyces sp. Q6]|uniref:Uncharacterized protein n=1 Tax=Streptomyces citrinus TaxID=3118173 RepID=A0ACD5AD29_9ACTN